MSASINMNSMLMEMNAMRLQAGGLDQLNPNIKLPDTGVQQTSGAEFSDMLQQALNGVNNMQVESETLKTNFDLGDRSVSLANVMIAGQKAGLALEATVQVRNKMVEAYKTIMQMSI